MSSSTDHVTAYEGANTIGISYPDRELCLPCSVLEDPSDLPYLLEDKVITDRFCARCLKQI